MRDDLNVSQNERYQEWLTSQGIREVSCLRCTICLRVRLQAGNEKARLLKHSDRPEGWCASCAMTDFIRNQSHLGEIIEGRGAEGRQMLLDPRIQQQFAGLMQSGNADAKPDEINWQRVIENWDLPFTKPSQSKKRIGDV